MSEKKFTLTDWHEVKNNGRIMTVDEVVDMLNEQNKRIEDLEKENNRILERNVQINSVFSELDSQYSKLLKGYERLLQSVASAEKSREYWVKKYYKLCDEVIPKKEDEIKE